MQCQDCKREVAVVSEGRCPACCARYEEKKARIAAYANLLRDESPQKEKKESRTLVLVILLGFLCPVIWIVYLLSHYGREIGAGAKKIGRYIAENSTSSFAEAPPPCPTSVPEEETPPAKEFVFYGGDGNYYRSGGYFCDFQGNLVKWGDPFRDSRNNIVCWGDPFYDGHDSYVGWGEPFYDSKGNYIVPR